MPNRALYGSPSDGCGSRLIFFRGGAGPLNLFLRVLINGCRPRRDLVLENLALRHQLEVLGRARPKPCLRTADGVLWVWLRRIWPSAWARHLTIVRPETVIGWHRQGWRLYWTWRSRTRLGRPRLSAEVRELIARMSQENGLWGTERIRGELLKLGIVASHRSIRRYRWRVPKREGSQSWSRSCATRSRAFGRRTYS